MPEPPIVLVSNRGPVSFALNADGGLQPHRGAGGLVSGLGSLGERGDCMWIAAAFTAGDRRAAELGEVDAAGFEVRLLDIAPETWRDHYDVVSNSTLWFLHHGLFDPSRTPSFDDEWRAAWEAHRGVNDAFADAVAEAAPEGARVLVQDYHLGLLGAALRTRRPDLRTVHFHHTPFCGRDEIGMLPDDVAGDLVTGLAGFDARGFHTQRWADAFEASAGAVGIDAGPSFVAPLGIDAADLAEATATAECAEELARIDDLVGGRRLVARVDRIELSKNLLRGFDAFELLLERSPEWRNQVVFGAFCYPSREGVEEYARYRADLEARVEAINSRWSSGDWLPIVLETDDDFPRSLAALRRNDVLVVNPVRDGLNLVAMEGAVVNERDGALVLSRNAGAWASLADASDGVNPFDVSETATALATALSRDPAAKREQAARRRAIAAGRTAHDWLEDQLAVIGN